MSDNKHEEAEPMHGAKGSSVQTTDTENYGSISVAYAYQSPSHTHHIGVYKRRWWIVVVFSLVSLAQSCQWNTWGPISDAVEIVYGWNDSVVTTIPAVSNAAFIVFGFLMMYAIEIKGNNDRLIDI